MRKILPPLCALLLLYCTLPVKAQGQTGTPPFSTALSQDGPDVIDPANLNIHLTIPIFSRPGRGIPFSYSLGYDSTIWQPVGGAWHPAPGWGWTAQSAAAAGYVTDSQTYTACYGYVDEYTYVQMGYTANDYFTYTDPGGTAHSLPFNTYTAEDWYAGQIVLEDDCTGGNYYQTYDDMVPATDGSGYAMNTSEQVVSRSGTVLSVPINVQTGPASITDSNGNQITINSSGVVTDTIGTAPLNISGPTYTYSTPGGTATYSVQYQPYNIRTSFGVCGITEYSGSASLISEIDLPDGSSYKFTYEPTQGYSGYVTGRLASLTLPTGGVINYSYNSDIQCDGSGYYLTRQTPDGTWTYQHFLVNGPTTITDPAGNQSSMVFSGTYLTEEDDYSGTTSGGTLLRTIDNCYNGVAPPCNTQTVSQPISEIKKYVQWGGSSGPKSITDTLYNSYGLVTEIDEYPYGNSTTPTRKTLTSYATTLSNDILDRPYQITVEDPNNSNAVIAQTTYTYDGGTLQPSGAPQLVSVSGSRGNPTTIVSRANSTTNISRTISYFDSGMIQVSHDFDGNPTTYGYSSAYGYALPTTITNALNQTTTNAYDSNTGLLTSTMDPNNATTSYSYDVMLRPTQVNYADGGQTTIGYPSPNEIDVTQKIDSSRNETGSVILDGLGRTSQTKLTSDPEGTDYVDTVYDSLGRVHSESNPYRTTSDPTYGLMLSSYDALSRPTLVTDQDGSMSGIAYSANCATVTDEAGKAREGCTDAAGRLTDVYEDPNGVNQHTTYTYDLLDDLTGVTQVGSHQRTFNYDGLARLSSATNPESGTTSYTYDGNGNVLTKISPLPNQTGSATLTTTYSYDALNRLTQKSYSDGITPAANFQYDATSDWGSTLTNTKGRLTESWTSGTPFSASVYSYDSMGRVLTRLECTPYTCGSGGWNTYYTYDMLGDLTSATNGQGVTFSDSYDTTGRLSALTSSLVDANHPATLWTADSTQGYYPNGDIKKALFGNGLTEAIGEESRLQPCRIDLNSSGTFLGTCDDSLPSGNIQHLHYTYGAWGSTNNGDVTNWVGIGTQNFNRTYSYDALNRLQSMSAPGDTCSGLSWTYDAWGNRNVQNPTGGTCNSFNQTADANNHLPASAGYQYDAAGNMTHDASHSYTYDAENRITKVDGGSTAKYLYDTDGKRTETTAGGTTLEYIYDAFGHVVAKDNGTSWWAGYAYAGDSFVAQYTSGKTFFAQSDNLGSVRLLTDLSGNVAESADYLPFGEATISGNGEAWSDFLFTGYQRDSETGLDNAQARYNSSAMGRFMSPDPGNAGADLANPQSWNMYSYVNNNPLNAIDPTGMDCAYINQDSGAWAGSDTTDPTYPTICDSNDAAFYIPGNITGYTGGPYTFEVQYCPFDTNFYTSADGGPSTSCEPEEILTTQISVPRPPSPPCEGDASSSNPCSNQPQPAPTTGGGGGGSVGGGASPDDPAKNLARALNKTGIQSLRNPCTIAAFFTGSAVAGAIGGAAAGGEVADAAGNIYKASSRYWPPAFWLARQRFATRIASSFEWFSKKTGDAVQNACNAMQQ